MRELTALEMFVVVVITLIAYISQEYECPCTEDMFPVDTVCSFNYSLLISTDSDIGVLPREAVYTQYGLLV